MLSYDIFNWKSFNIIILALWNVIKIHLCIVLFSYRRRNFLDPMKYLGKRLRKEIHLSLT